MAFEGASETFNMIIFFFGMFLAFSEQLKQNTPDTH